MRDKKTYQIILKPVGTELTAHDGTPLRDILFDQGAEFPCGGQGRCRGCRVKVLDGDFAVNDAMRERLTAPEIGDGWRLACQCTVHGDATLELRQWDMPVLVDDTELAIAPREGFGVAVDLGTTTLVAQLLDLSTGNVLGVRTALNPQARYGGDVMSRVQFAVSESGQPQLEEAIRIEIGALIQQLLLSAHVVGSDVRRVTVVGNTVMHHLFCGIDVEPMSHTPFEPKVSGLCALSAQDLGWDFGGNPAVQFLPYMGGFVGSDILAGVLATDIHEHDDLAMLVDLGTNGEIVLGNREKLLCASTAAGPAFEGARIHQGMRAATGAIWQVRPRGHLLNGNGNGHGSLPEGEHPACSNDWMEADVIGGGRPRGICGSGLVDAVAVALEGGLIRPNGRLADAGTTLPLCKPVSLTQTDVRELQLAKGAIAAGIRLLLNRWGATPEDVRVVYLAGAFGNYINRASAQRIGLIDFPPEKVSPVGNTALLGAKMALFLPDGVEPSYPDILARTEHVSLNEEPDFQDVYAECMGFPKERQNGA